MGCCCERICGEIKYVKDGKNKQKSKISFIDESDDGAVALQEEEEINLS